MQFDEVFDGDVDDAAVASTSNDADSKGKKDVGGESEEGDPDLQFAESFNPLLRFSRGDLDNMDKEVDDMVRNIFRFHTYFICALLYLDEIVC